MKRKSRRWPEKVSKMGGSESKATVLECMIKILRRDFGGDYGVKMEKALAPHSSTLAWRIPGTGEPGGLPSMGSHRVGHD